ncbi:hypothetical protein [Embleya sp. NPDC020630]|uniref:hypothetical protein n=1 Tax=Embleya sp. NPDC020630 TaxID=3363979 RepID=UPI003794B0AA
MIENRLKAAAERIAREIPTPFYVVDPSGVERDFSAMGKAWREWFPRCTLAYSYKSNPLTAFTRLLCALGATAEVVSGPELEIALRDGFPPDRILFDGPVKHAAELTRALTLGVGVQIDSAAEVEHVAAAIPEGGPRPRVCLRLAIGTDSGEWSRFGLMPDEVPRARRILADAGVRVRGVHLGVGTLVGGPQTYRAAIRLWRETLPELAHDAPEPFVLNIGGGFPPRGDTADPAAPWAEFAAEVAEECGLLGLRPRDVHLVVEPGRSLAEEHGVLVARVAVRKRRAEGPDLLVLDAGTNLARTVKSRHHPIEFVSSGTDDAGGTRDVPGADCAREPYVVYGNNCYEGDVFTRAVDGPSSLGPGQLVLVGSVGAYDMPFAHVWVRPRPPVYAAAGTGHVLVRKPGRAIR